MVCHGEDPGVILNPETGTQNKFTSAHGVYLLRMLVKTDVVDGPSSTTTRSAAPAPPIPEVPGTKSQPTKGFLNKACPFGRPVVCVWGGIALRTVSQLLCCPAFS